MAVGLFHPVEALSSVTTARWVIVHALATLMCCCGLLGLTGLYARQVNEVGWPGLAGYLLLSLWMMLTAPFTFAEAVILPRLATESPTFVAGFLGIFTGSVGQANLGALPTLWMITGPLYILGGVLFGSASLRVGILSRWAAGLLVVGAALAPVAALLPHEFKAIVATPVGLALAGLGYALWAEPREHAAAPVPDRTSSRLHATGVE
jgi:hypothetical protein